MLGLFHYPNISASLTNNFFCTKKEGPSEGGSVRGAALSTEKQASNHRRKLTCDICMPRNDGAS